MKLKDDELKSILVDLKKVVKGRPLYFGLMAPGAKRGKFKLSKKKGDTKPPTLKSEFNPYEDDKDNKLKGTACQGVITAEKGVLTLHVDGKAPGAAVKFLTHFILREVKYKVVKSIAVAEEVKELPIVPEEDEAGLTWEQLLKRLTTLMTELKDVDESQRAPVIQPATAAKQIIDQKDAASPEQLGKADDLLDEAFSLLREIARSAQPDPVSSIDVDELQRHLERARTIAALLPSDLVSGIASRINQGAKELKEENFEAAEDIILGLEDEIDGAFQDYFLTKLRPLSKIENELPEDIAKLLDPCRNLIRRRTWQQATEAWNDIEKKIQQWHAQRKADTVPPPPEAPAPPTGAVPPPPPTETVEDALEKEAWQQRHNDLVEQRDSMLKADENAIDEATQKKIAALLLKSEELALTSFDYSKAAMAHGGVSKLLVDSLMPPDDVAVELGITPGLVAFRQSQLRWKQGLQDVERALGKMASAIRSTSPDDADLADELGIVLEEFEGVLEDIIDAGINAEDDVDRAPHSDNALKLIGEFRQHISSDEIIQQLDTCPFCKIDIRGTLTTTLNDLSKHLKAYMAL